MKGKSVIYPKNDLDYWYAGPYSQVRPGSDGVRKNEGGKLKANVKKSHWPGYEEWECELGDQIGDQPDGNEDIFHTADENDDL